MASKPWLRPNAKLVTPTRVERVGVLSCKSDTSMFGIKAWYNHFYVVVHNDATLREFDSEAAFASDANAPLRAFDLKTAEDVQEIVGAESESSRHKHRFDILWKRHEYSLCLNAASSAEQNEWVSAIFLCSPVVAGMGGIATTAGSDDGTLAKKNKVPADAAVAAPAPALPPPAATGPSAAPPPHPATEASAVSAGAAGTPTEPGTDSGSAGAVAVTHADMKALQDSLTAQLREAQAATIVQATTVARDAAEHAARVAASEARSGAKSDLSKAVTALEGKLDASVERLAKREEGGSTGVSSSAALAQLCDVQDALAELQDCLDELTLGTLADIRGAVVHLSLVSGGGGGGGGTGGELSQAAVPRSPAPSSSSSSLAALPASSPSRDVAAPMQAMANVLEQLTDGSVSTAVAVNQLAASLAEALSSLQDSTSQVGGVLDSNLKLVAAQLEGIQALSSLGSDGTGKAIAEVGAKTDATLAHTGRMEEALLAIRTSSEHTQRSLASLTAAVGETTAAVHVERLAQLIESVRVQVQGLVKGVPGALAVTERTLTAALAAAQVGTVEEVGTKLAATQESLLVCVAASSASVTARVESSEGALLSSLSALSSRCEGRSDASDGRLADFRDVTAAAGAAVHAGVREAREAVLGVAEQVRAVAQGQAEILSALHPDVVSSRDGVLRGALTESVGDVVAMAFAQRLDAFEARIEDKVVGSVDRATRQLERAALMAASAAPPQMDDVGRGGAAHASLPPSSLASLPGDVAAINLHVQMLHARVAEVEGSMKAAVLGPEMLDRVVAALVPHLSTAVVAALGTRLDAMEARLCALEHTTAAASETLTIMARTPIVAGLLHASVGAAYGHTHNLPVHAGVPRSPPPSQQAQSQSQSRYPLGGWPARPPAYNSQVSHLSGAPAAFSLVQRGGKGEDDARVNATGREKGASGEEGVRGGTGPSPGDPTHGGETHGGEEAGRTANDEGTTPEPSLHATVEEVGNGAGSHAGNGETHASPDGCEPQDGMEGRRREGEDVPTGVQANDGSGEAQQGEGPPPTPTPPRPLTGVEAAAQSVSDLTPILHDLRLQAVQLQSEIHGLTGRGHVPISSLPPDVQARDDVAPLLARLALVSDAIVETRRAVQLAQAAALQGEARG